MDAYATVEQADEYMMTRLHADAWNDADEGTKMKALVTATHRIDALRLRRTWTGTEDAPDPVRYACIEEALALLSQTTGERRQQARAMQGITSERVGDASRTWDATVAQRLATGGLQLLSAEARSLLAPYRVGAGAIV